MTEKICTICSNCSIHCQIYADQYKERLKLEALTEAKSLAEHIHKYTKAGKNSKIGIVFVDDVNVKEAKSYIVKVYTVNGLKELDCVKVDTSTCESLKMFFFFSELTNVMKKYGYATSEAPELQAVNFAPCSQLYDGYTSHIVFVKK